MLSRVLSPFIDGADAFIEQMHFLFQEPAMELLEAGAGLWVIGYLLFNVILGRNLEPAKLFKRLLLICMALALVDNYSYFEEYLYHPVRSFFDYATIAVIERISFTNLTDMVGAVASEPQYQALDVVWQVFLKSHDIAASITPPHWYQKLWVEVVGTCLMLPFFVMAVLYALFYAEYIIKLGIIGGLAPFLISAYAFDKTRAWASGALKILFHGGVTILIATMMIAFSVSTISNIFQQLTDPSTGLWDPEQGVLGPCLEMFAVGCICALFQLKAPTIAANITGAQDGPGAAAALTAMAGGAFAKMGAGVWGGTDKQAEAMKSGGIKQGLGAAMNMPVAAGKMAAQGFNAVTDAMIDRAVNGTKAKMMDKSIDK